MISHYKQFRKENLRLHNHDYSKPGYYFITLCVNNKERIFGRINNGNMFLNEYGEIIEQCWHDLSNHYHNMKLDAYVVMPNHFHCIIRIPYDREELTTKKNHGLSEFVRALKTFSSRRINEARGTIGKPVWQRRYYDRIIRDDGSLSRIRQYILNNPAKWNDDLFYQL